MDVCGIILMGVLITGAQPGEPLPPSAPSHAEHGIDSWQPLPPRPLLSKRPACDDGGCGACGCGACGCGAYGRGPCRRGARARCWPRPFAVWRSPCDMYQHTPYVTKPKMYYYLRPYNWFHIPIQQREVSHYGGDPRNPYDNRMFQNVYHEVEAAWDPSHLIPPPELLPPGDTAPRRLEELPAPDKSTVGKKPAGRKGSAKRPLSEPADAQTVRSGRGSRARVVVPARVRLGAPRKQGVSTKNRLP